MIALAAIKCTQNLIQKSEINIFNINNESTETGTTQQVEKFYRLNTTYDFTL